MTRNPRILKFRSHQFISSASRLIIHICDDDQRPCTGSRTSATVPSQTRPSSY
jgi:hypothetical protein